MYAWSKNFIFTIKGNTLSTLSFLSILFNSNGNEKSGVICGHRNNGVSLDQFNFISTSVFSCKKLAYANIVFTLMLV